MNKPTLKTRLWLPAAGALLVLAGASFAASASGWPSKPVRIVVNFAPAGGVDVFARAMAQKFVEAWGQPVVVDNRGGANGNIGAEVVAKAPADGYTLLLTTNATIVINPSLGKLPYDAVKDFAPVSQLTSVPFVLVVHPSVPATNVTELIALARAKPGQLNYASSGAGGGAHLSGEMLKTIARIDITHVPYKGGGPALVAVAGAQVHFLFVGIMTAMPLVEAKKLRAIAVTGNRRSSALPDVPTVVESPGLADFQTDLWYGLLATAKTDPKVVDRLYRETRRMFALPEFRNRFEPAGITLVGSSPAEFAKTIKADLARWAAVIKSSGVKLEQ